ncbi:MAG: hypothetical protein WC650_00315 [Candidatus Doudnabacteria bacterium]
MIIHQYLQKHQTKIFLILIFLEALAPFFWLNTLWLSIGDFAFTFSPEDALRTRIFTWNPVYLGYAQDRGTALLPAYQLPIYLLHKINLPLLEIERLLFSYWLLTAGFAFFILMRHILKGRLRELAAFLAANLYMFNVFSFLFLWPRAMVLFAYGFLPLILLFCIRILKRPTKKDCALLVLTAFLASPAADNPVYLFLIFGIVVYYFLMNLLLSKQRKKVDLKKQIQHFLLLSGSLFLTWSLIILPYTAAFFNEQEEIAQMADTNLKHIAVVNSFYKMADGLRFLGHWGFWGKFKGYLYYPYGSLYEQPFFILLGFIIPILAYSAFAKNKYKKYTLIFGILSLVSFALLYGPNPPLGSIYKFLFSHFETFSMFRNPLDKIGMIFIFAFSLLLGIAIHRIMEKIKLKYAFAFALLTLFVIHLCALPFWQGQVLPDYKSGILATNKTSIPLYYREISTYLNKKQMAFRAYALPMQWTYFTPYKWNYQGVDPLYYYLGEKFFATYQKSISDPIYQMLYSIRQQKDFFNTLLKLAGFFNMQYIILENDVDDQFYENSDSPREIKENLEKEKDINLVQSFGPLELYEVSSVYFLPHLYVPEEIKVSSQFTKDLPEVLSSQNLLKPTAIYLADSKEQSQKTSSLPTRINEKPILEFKKINPTKYIVFIHKARENFPLILSETFSKDWKIYQIKRNIDLSYSNNNSFDSLLQDYKILEGNEENQAQKEEVSHFIEKGWVSTLGDGREKKIKYYQFLNSEKKELDHLEKYKIAFISKNYQDTIQNENLKGGPFWETWGRKPLAQDQHFIVNGYANSWWLDVQKICEQPSNCIKNQDGSYDFALTVEFWPQRLFYLGLTISSIFFIISCGYLVWILAKKVKNDIIKP